MKQTGQMLREHREKLGLTIHEISLALKINSRIIKAMEEGNSAQLPPRTFLRGFVQSYATYLKLDMDQLMETFQSEMEPKVSEASGGDTLQVAPHPEGKESAPWQKLLFWNNHPSKFTTVLVGAAALVLVFSIILVSRTIEKYQRERNLSVTKKESVENLASSGDRTPAKDTDEDAPGDAPPLTAPEVKSSEPVPVSSPSKSEPTPAPMKVVDVLTPAKELPAPSTQAKPPSVAVVAPPAPAVETKPEAKAKPEEVKKPADGSPQEIIVEAMDKVDVEVRIDGGDPQAFKLSADQIRTFKAKKRLQIKISDGGAASIIHNGKDLGVPGDLGKPVSLNYPK